MRMISYQLGMVDYLLNIIEERCGILPLAKKREAADVIFCL